MSEQVERIARATMEAVHASARKLSEESKGHADNEGFLARMYLDLAREAEALRAALVELVRLKDWRDELGQMEKHGHHQEEMCGWLLRYGREKAAAWAEARRVLA